MALLIPRSVGTEQSNNTSSSITSSGPLLISRSTPTPPAQPTSTEYININGQQVPASSIVNNPSSPYYADFMKTQQPQQPKPNLDQQISNIPLLGGIYQAGKQVVEFAPKAPGYVKSAVTNPLPTAAGGGEAVLTGFGSLAGVIQHGIAKAANIEVPERWDISKQVSALKELDDTILKKSGMDEQRAFDTGRFLGAMVPYTLGGELVGASLGAKILTPLVSKFLPGAVKFIPAINDAIGFLGVGQIEYTPEEGSRVDRVKNDLTMLALFKITNFAVGKGAGAISDATKKTVNNVVDSYSAKFKKGEDVNLDQMEADITKAKQSIQEDTGQMPETIVAQTMAENKKTKGSFQVVENSAEPTKAYKVQTSDQGTILTPKEKPVAEIKIENAKLKTALDDQIGKVKDEAEFVQKYRLLQEKLGLSENPTNKKVATYMDSLDPAAYYKQITGHQVKSSDTVKSNGKQEVTKSQTTQKTEAANDKGGKVENNKTKVSKPQEKAVEGFPPLVGEGKLKETRYQERLKKEIEESAADYEGIKIEDLKAENASQNVYNLKEGLKRATDFALKNPEQAYRIAKGLEKQPKDLNVTPAHLKIAVAHIAKANGDSKTFADLVAKISRDAAAEGKDIVSLRGTFASSTPESFIKEVIKARLERVAQLYSSSMTDKGKSVLGIGESAATRGEKVVQKQAEKLKEELTAEQIKIKKAQDIIEILKCK